MAHKTKKENGKQAQGFFFTAPGANSVQLVGDFTQWTERPINLRMGAKGIWHAKVELEPGEHRYRFLVDGQWRDDPECRLHVSNPYGGQDSVREVTERH